MITGGKYEVNRRMITKEFRPFSEHSLKITKTEQVSEGFEEITEACSQNPEALCEGSRMIYQDVRRILKHHSNHPEASSKVLEHLNSLEKEEKKLEMYSNRTRRQGH